MLKIPFYIPVPAVIERIGVWGALLYRKHHFGYAFRLIPLTQGKFAIVDPEDFEKFNQYKWQAIKTGRTFYAKRSKRIGDKIININLHREILRPGKDLVVDHINHNGLDNRKANLRVATPLQNSWNSIRVSRSRKYRCVKYHKTYKKWYVLFFNNWRKIRSGYFDSEIEAAKAYDQTIKKYRGEFAILNFGEK